MSDLLQDRYGTGHPRRRIVVIVATTVLGVVFLGWLAWAAWIHSDQNFDAELSAYDVVSAHEAKLKMEISVRHPDPAGSCLIRATAQDHTIVGELTLTVKAMTAAQGHWIPIRTEQRATTVEKVRCTNGP